MKTKNKKQQKKYTVPLQLEKINWEKVENIFSSDRSLILRKWDKEKIRNPGTKEILGLLAGGAVISLSLFIPTAPLIAAPFILNRDKYNGWWMNRQIGRLREQKLVKIDYTNEQTVVRITEKGRMRALRYKLTEMAVKTPKRWDKKWRLVIFDIPEKYKRMREIFRHQLQVMGFYPLQKSVWMHPYPCFNEIEFLRQIYHVGINVTYIVAESIEETEDLKEHFKL